MAYTADKPAGAESSDELHARIPGWGVDLDPKDLSGMMRKYAYRRFSEGRAAHWLILMVADRVDSLGSHFQSLLTLRPDNPITETGVFSEFTCHGIASRVGKKRADLTHQPLDVIIIAAPWVVAGGAVYQLLKRLRKTVVRAGRY